MQINVENKTIVYANHVVALVVAYNAPAPIVRIELQDMADYLAADGTAEQHAKQLEAINNDGSWVVMPKCDVAGKWTLATSPRGRQRPFIVMGTMAINTAFAEGLPFTMLSACNVPGRNVTHNMPKNV